MQLYFVLTLSRYIFKEMKKVSEMIIRKDTTINKVQFDKEWFYSIKDVADYLGEPLEGVEYIHLPIEIDGVKFTVKVATWEDIERARQKEPLEDYRGSVLRNKPDGKSKRRKK